MQKQTIFFGLVVLAGIADGLPADPRPIPQDQFPQLIQKIKPQAGESLFWQVPWLLSLDEALQKGAAEGKPIIVWSGAGGAPHTVC